MNFYSIIPYAVYLFHKYDYIGLNTLQRKGKGQSIRGSNIVNQKRTAHRQKLGGDASVHHSFVHGT